MIFLIWADICSYSLIWISITGPRNGMPTTTKGTFLQKLIKICPTLPLFLFCNLHKDIMFSLWSILAILKLFKNYDDGFNMIVFIPNYFVLLNPCPSNWLITISAEWVAYTWIFRENSSNQWVVSLYRPVTVKQKQRGKIQLCSMSHADYTLNSCWIIFE